LFVINIQGLHENFDKYLPGEIVYSQEIVESTSEKDCIEKSFYFFKKNQLLAQQQLIYRIFKGNSIEELFNRVGLKLERKDRSGQLVIYSKK